MRKRRLKIVSSAKAFREGHWPRKEWGVFDETGKLQFTATTRQEASQWATTKEKK